MGWWELELSTEEKEKYLKFIRFNASVPLGYTIELAVSIIKNLVKTNSIFCIFQLQELFSLTSELRISNPEEERINVPGTISEQNWTYRIYSSLEFLQNYEKFIMFLRSIINQRQARSLDRKH
jgi:4-alpha-glucanotransferase